MTTDEKIEFLAREICKNVGLDPDEITGHGFGNDFTSAEWREYRGHTIPAAAFHSPTWRLYRRRAEEALATAEALKTLEIHQEANARTGFQINTTSEAVDAFSNAALGEVFHGVGKPAVTSNT